MKVTEMTKNRVFREIICNLSVKETVKLCGINSSDITKWDEGEPIPSGYKRLMRFHRRMELSYLDEWEGFKIEGGRLILPTGARLTAAQVLTGSALIEIECCDDLRTQTKLLRIARAIAKLKHQATN